MKNVNNILRLLLRCILCTSHNNCGIDIDKKGIIDIIMRIIIRAFMKIKEQINKIKV